ncbi:9180_t:CDS:1, partial [Racocetra persica]
ANSNNSFLVNKSSLEKGQIIAKLREIDSRQVAETVTKGLDAAASLATLGGPPGLAVSLVLGVISGSIKI